jgi:GNAT superfamily N-acetyltransferase
MTAPSYELTLLPDAQDFLDLAGDWLAVDPVVTTVVAVMAHRVRDETADGVEQPLGDRLWWLVVRDADGAVVGAGMRTATFATHPPYLLPMPDAAAVELARRLHGRGESVEVVNGTLPAIEVFGQEWARLRGGTPRVVLRTRLFELGELRAPRGVGGRLRLARPDDADLAFAWFEVFHADADEQAGRPPDAVTGTGAAGNRDDIDRRIAAGRIWLWEDEQGAVVHLTGATLPSFGVARIGPVFTPRELRGRGYARAAVAEVSRLLRERGARVCLFTDQANPSSNRVYESIGFRPVVEMANLLVAAETG